MMRKKNILLDYTFIVIGTTFLALALNIFYEPHHLITGGVTGIAIIIAHITDSIYDYVIPISITNLVLNIPLFILGVKILGKDLVLRTIFSTIFLSIALTYTSFIQIKTDDYMLAAVFGGTLAGVGLGLVFRSMATTGGTDLAASIIHKYIKHISVAKILLFIDSIIIAIGFFTFGITNAMYSAIAVYISSKVIDTILEGLSFSKGAFIISEKSEIIAEKIIYTFDRGVTSLKGQGMYTKREKNVLLCVVNKKQIIKVKEMVQYIDPKAFIIVTDIREVLGEGFRSIN